MDMQPRPSETDTRYLSGTGSAHEMAAHDSRSVAGARLLPGAAYVIVGGYRVPLIRGGDGTDDDKSGNDPKTSSDPPADGNTQAKDGTKDDAFDRDRARSTIDRLKQTEKDLKRQLQELKPLADAAREAADKDKSDAQKLQERLQTVESELAQARETAATTTIRLEVERAARKLGFIDEDDAFRLLDRDAIVFDDGKPQNVAELLGTLAKAKPHLVKAAASDDSKNGEDQKQPAAAGKGPDPTPKPTTGDTGKPSERELQQREAAARQFYRSI
jgi:hypothetical protein